MKGLLYGAFVCYALWQLAPLLAQPGAWIAVLFVLVLIAIGKPETR